MDYEKLKEYGQNIKLTDEAKAEITAQCKAVQSKKRGSILLTAAVKRTAAVFAAAAVIIAGIVCVKYLKQPAPKIDNTEKSSTVGSTVENSTVTTPTQTATKSENTETTENDIGGGRLTVQKYRSIFYSIPSPFVELVGRDVYYEWIYTVDHTDKAEKMLMPQFIQDFGITREQFDKANLEFARIVRDDLKGRPCINPKDYANQISDEIFNGDIVFTFDDEIINEYYLSPEYPYLYSFEFDEAVANGTYTARTDEWVDVEQMEAEINAKYGAPEVTETATAIPEETQATE